jgi:hypothetical protein
MMFSPGRTIFLHCRKPPPISIFKSVAGKQATRCKSSLAWADGKKQEKSWTEGARVRVKGVVEGRS